MADNPALALTGEEHTKLAEGVLNGLRHLADHQDPSGGTLARLVHLLQAAGTLGIDVAPRANIVDPRIEQAGQIIGRAIAVVEIVEQLGLSTDDFGEHRRPLVVALNDLADGLADYR